ncbi:ABC transporter substrate-binding protein [Paenibacillus sp. GYB003]|uniref:ABC transporter substrate-binding protein n=1 Tax=Paenibacillus sp. GYB003 TaxID=2994392 RepID=UPI002F96627E
MTSFLLLAGCGRQTDGSPAVSKPAGRSDAGTTVNGTTLDTGLTARLSLYMDLSLSDEWLRQFVIDPVRKKFPNMTIDIVRKKEGAGPGDLVAAGSFPDLLYSSTPRLTQYRDLGLLYDMRELSKKHNVPLDRLNKPALDALEQWGRGGELYGLPLWVNYTALYYNKDLFDRFGVPYPKDGMTWDETIELSKRLTRSDGNTAYRGLDIHDMNGLYSQLSLPYVDPKTDAALLDTDGFKTVYATMQKLYSIPGNGNRTPAKDAFLKDMTLAMWPMYADVPAWINDLVAKGTPFNWDMAQMPSFPARPGVGWQVDSHNLHVTSTSANKEAAFSAVAYLLSAEPQLELAKYGLPPSLNDDEWNRHFGEGMPIFKGKHIEAVFKSKPAPKYTMTPYDSIAMSAFTGSFKDVESGVKDINTALREAKETADRNIREKKASENKGNMIGF